MLRVTCHNRHSELVYDILGAHEEIVQVWLGLKRGKCIRELLQKHADGREEEYRCSSPTPLLIPQTHLHDHINRKRREINVPCRSALHQSPDHLH